MGIDAPVDYARTTLLEQRNGLDGLGSHQPIHLDGGQIIVTSPIIKQKLDESDVAQLVEPTVTH
jgi:hypothetical protein